jgi:hypothetical protein
MGLSLFNKWPSGQAGAICYIRMSATTKPLGQEGDSSESFLGNTSERKPRAHVPTLVASYVWSSRERLDEWLELVPWISLQTHQSIVGSFGLEASVEKQRVVARAP